jgi:hypothetical protein
MSNPATIQAVNQLSSAAASSLEIFLHHFGITCPTFTNMAALQPG